MPFIDTLETFFTNRPRDAQRNRLARPLLRRAPDRGLRPEDCYSLHLYLRCGLRPVIKLCVAYYLFLLGLLVWLAVKLGRMFPVLYHGGAKQAEAWRFMWRALGETHFMQHFGLMPFVPLIWVLFGLLFWLPRVLFWNRRARRLRLYGEAVSIPTANEEITPQDASIWPPAPKAG